ncbi:acetyl esterase [Thalassospira sp. MBR-102]|jgi:acetyl esterase|uniref:alpha/beta hydrolase n=1 Tax=Thalassospira TaxID=168934 RepID=UPI0008DC705C|nr:MULTISPECIES: alpha/beta hydrolase [Thalassospira]MAB34333.1 alpha/beta hydrolase [Thalassospira sp.]MDM7977336.1 alpha/beta hydrolase [Thalassospira xiamenensis]OHY98024.1 lipase [Thalassospira sp. MIT1004]HBS23400.1 alpha/beta hydrolase [Thalassospira sp.]
MNTFKTTVASAAFALAATLATTTALANPVLENNTQNFINALTASGGAPIYTLSPADARNVLAGAQAGPIAKRAADVTDTVFPVGPTGETRVRIVRPEGNTDRLPVVVYFHGGGWVLGDKETHDRLIREIAVQANAVVVFVDYERSPEAKYPIAIEQDYAVTKYVAEHSEQLNVDPTRLAIAGDSVGGNMTAVVSLLAEQRKGPEIIAQVLFYPVTDANFENGSYTEFANGPWLTKAAMEWFWNQYLPEGTDRTDPKVTPIHAPQELLAGQAPALIITDENDVLRDEGEAYARKLSQAGVDVTTVRYNGTIHDFVMLNAIADTPAAKAATAQASQFLKNAFYGE